PAPLPRSRTQHHPTGGNCPPLLRPFRVWRGAAHPRHISAQPKQAKDSPATPATLPDQLDRFGRRLRPPAPLTQQAVRPDAEPRPVARPDSGGLSAEPGQPGRNAKRLARPGEAPDAARAKLSKRGKPGAEEPPKSEA